MCQILFALDRHPRYPLVLAANRDEFYARPSARAAFWPDQPQLLAGRDLSAGGTWLGATRDGRWAAVTNYRQVTQNTAPRSRGELVTGFLCDNPDPADYLASLLARADDYAGFNLLLGTLNGVWFADSRSRQIRRLEPGLHGLSNGELDNDWPKVVEGKARLAAALVDDEPDWAAIYALMTDREPAATERLPDTGIGLERERALSAQFIVTPTYGTRCTTLLSRSTAGEICFQEWGFGADGQAQERLAYRWQTGAPSPDQPR